MSDPLNRKPWSMKWVVLAIIACVIPYTWITIAYRKPNPAFQPYEDSKQRANVLRLLEAGYQRIQLPVTAPAGPKPDEAVGKPGAEVVSVAGGLTEDLSRTLVETPPLPLSFTSVVAARETSPALPYSIAFACVPGEQKHPLSGAQVFIKELEVVIVPSFASSADPSTLVSGGPVLLTLPAGTFKAPGRHTVLLVGTTESRQWTIDVR